MIPPLCLLLRWEISLEKVIHIERIRLQLTNLSFPGARTKRVGFTTYSSLLLEFTIQASYTISAHVFSVLPCHSTC